MYVMNFVFTVNEIDELLEIFHALKSKCIYGQTAFERTALQTHNNKIWADHKF